MPGFPRKSQRQTHTPVHAHVPGQAHAHLVTSLGPVRMPENGVKGAKNSSACFENKTEMEADCGQWKIRESQPSTSDSYPWCLFSLHLGSTSKEAPDFYP